MGTSNNAWNRDRKNLLALFNWLRKTYEIKTNPVANIDRMPEERIAEYIPSVEDVDRVIMVAIGQDRVMLKCYYYTFARRSELFEWRWDDVNFENEWYRLWTRKRQNSDREADYFPMKKESELYEGTPLAVGAQEQKFSLRICQSQDGSEIYTAKNVHEELVQKGRSQTVWIQSIKKDWSPRS